MRPDYCPIGGEPCQSLCETPCSVVKRKPLAKELLESMAEACVTNCYFDTLKFARAIERAHGITGEQQ